MRSMGLTRPHRALITRPDHKNVAVGCGRNPEQRFLDCRPRWRWIFFWFKFIVAGFRRPPPNRFVTTGGPARPSQPVRKSGFVVNQRKGKGEKGR